MNAAAGVGFALERATASDFELLLALRLRAMRASLERIGRYDEARARERLAAAFAPEHTQHIVVDGRRVGFVVLKRLSHALRLDHLYIDPPAQRRGIGSAVLRWACAQADAELLPFELVALKGSEANRFYLRHGFVEVGEGEWDIDYLREPATPSVDAVRALWAAFEARDWCAARARMHDALQATRWTSGERLDGADAFVAAQARDLQGATIRLLELGHLQDGRVLSLVRIDDGPHSVFATTLFRVDDGRIAGVEEYRAAAAAPPPWPEAPGGRSTFDWRQDPRAQPA